MQLNIPYMGIKFCLFYEHLHQSPSEGFGCLWTVGCKHQAVPFHRFAGVFRPVANQVGDAVREDRGLLPWSKPARARITGAMQIAATTFPCSSIWRAS